VNVLADAQDRLPKLFDSDSFGNPLSDSNPKLFLPLGFAGGLLDRDTGQVRFGHRDYMPSVGRFTAQDPLGDTGGDHDPYDYCVDDPVGAVDPEGMKGALANASAEGTGISGAIKNWWNGINFFGNAAKAIEDAESFSDDFSAGVKAGEAGYPQVLDAKERQKRYYQRTAPDVLKDGLDIKR
jgi:RHS repeat-associated protein